MILHFSSQTMEAKWARHAIFQAVKKKKKKEKRNFNPEFYTQQKKSPWMKRESIYFQMMGKRICHLQTYLNRMVKEVL